jgi:hypothetical protein
VVGAETGNRKDRVVPDWQWAAKIVYYARDADIRVFLKNNIKTSWGNQMIQEWPRVVRP